MAYQRKIKALQLFFSNFAKASIIVKNTHELLKESRKQNTRSTKGRSTLKRTIRKPENPFELELTEIHQFLQSKEPKLKLGINNSSSTTNTSSTNNNLYINPDELFKKPQSAKSTRKSGFFSRIKKSLTKKRSQTPIQTPIINESVV